MAPPHRRLRICRAGNIAYARNKILNKEEEYKPFDYMRITGQPVGTFYGLVADGMYQDGDFNADGSLREGFLSPRTRIRYARAT